jgi:hypothetical protein
MLDTKKFLEDTHRNADSMCGIFSAYRINIPPKDTVRLSAPNSAPLSVCRVPCGQRAGRKTKENHGAAGED